MPWRARGRQTYRAISNHMLTLLESAASDGPVKGN
ncbi:hypothetical protein EV137_7175 [Kribbella pratensis]|jgi:hypothetical protein|uniref:Uncharacterized protein n=1 Tax=Kribbella pratensis TaxID=2512112 RepID=A0ABY2F7S1_9ACTN|nr:hypothetical protein EV137_7175 [Kribbella pratensis]